MPPSTPSASKILKFFFTGFLPARSPEGACQKELRPAPHPARLDADRGIDAPFVVGDAGDVFHGVDDGDAEEPERVRDGQRAAPAAFSSPLAPGSIFSGARRGHRTSRRFDDGRKPRRTRRARRSRSGDIPVADHHLRRRSTCFGNAAGGAEPGSCFCRRTAHRRLAKGGSASGAFCRRRQECRRSLPPTGRFRS